MNKTLFDVCLEKTLKESVAEPIGDLVTLDNISIPKVILEKFYKNLTAEVSWMVEFEDTDEGDYIKCKINKYFHTDEELDFGSPLHNYVRMNKATTELNADEKISALEKQVQLLQAKLNQFNYLIPLK